MLDVTSSDRDRVTERSMESEGKHDDWLKSSNLI